MGDHHRNTLAACCLLPAACCLLPAACCCRCRRHRHRCCCCGLLTASCWLLAAGCWLLAAGWWLLAVDSLLLPPPLLRQGFCIVCATGADTADTGTADFAHSAFSSHP